jgi:hypothetical protein
MMTEIMGFLAFICIGDVIRWQILPVKFKSRVSDENQPYRLNTVDKIGLKYPLLDGMGYKKSLKFRPISGLAAPFWSRGGS